MLEYIKYFSSGITHSFLLGIYSILLCVPLALLVAKITRKENRSSSLALYFLDIFISLPNQLILITLAGVLGGGWGALLFSVFLTQFPTLVRHLRVHVLMAYESAFIEAQRAMGLGELRIFLRHALPKLGVALSVNSLLLFKRVILVESLLTFLGLGFDPLTPSLGRLISEGREALFWRPELFFAPVLFLVLLLFVLQSIADRFSSLFIGGKIRYL
jgi:peptide/nickel transport system permease protein